MTKFTQLLALVALVLATITGCETWPSEWPGNFPTPGIGFEMEITPLGQTSDLDLECEMRSSEWSGETQCVGMTYWWDGAVYRVSIPDAPPDARLTFTGTFYGFGDEDRAFCSNSPEEYVDAYFNGWPLDERRRSSCELDVDVDDLE